MPQQAATAPPAPHIPVLRRQFRLRQRAVVQRAGDASSAVPLASLIVLTSISAAPPTKDSSQSLRSLCCTSGV